VEEVRPSVSAWVIYIVDLFSPLTASTTSTGAVNLAAAGLGE